MSDLVRTRRELATAALGRMPGWSAVAAGLVGIGVLGYVDYVTGSEFAFSIFYLGPVLFVTWFVGRPAGTAMAVVAATTWGVIDVAAGARYSSALLPAWNSAMRLGFFLITLWLFAEMRRTNEALQELAHTDSLTGIGNARSLYAAVEREIERSRRYGHPFALAYADIDSFKEVNDVLGHATGDELLRRVAVGLTGVVRETDVVARLGGDEFGVLLPETDDQAAVVATGRVYEVMAAALHDGAQGVADAGVTVGTAVFMEPPESADAAVAAADLAMYEAKRAGKGMSRLVVHGPVAAEPEAVGA